MQVKPLRDYIFIQILEKEHVTHGGIVLNHKKDHPKARKGKVVSIGTGKRDDKGNLIPFDVQVGDTVLIGKHMGVALKVDNEELVRVTNDDILAVIDGRAAQADSFFHRE
jgi:chaperonin GroES